MKIATADSNKTSNALLTLQTAYEQIEGAGYSILIYGTRLSFPRWIYKSMYMNIVIRLSSISSNKHHTLIKAVGTCAIC